jgi:DeoR/GlpR family transcriptional regulator of sugar metabolism
MALINRRQQDILNELEQKGYVNVVDLCETHNVSTVTIRKDLNFLKMKSYYIERMEQAKTGICFE